MSRLLINVSTERTVLLLGQSRRTIELELTIREQLPGAVGRNPFVLATFAATSKSLAKRRRVLFYGHYDIVRPGPADTWKTDPFTLTGKDGWLYGRGVSDNKGPILSTAFAVASLVQQQKLDVDVVFFIEGEEEAQSEGFQQAVTANLDRIGPIDVILFRLVP